MLATTRGPRMTRGAAGRSQTSSQQGSGSEAPRGEVRANPGGRALTARATATTGTRRTTTTTGSGHGEATTGAPP
eukprot:3190190-Pyramimonas_sp.AAC.1